MCDKGFICECDKLCDIREYLGYKSCKCKKKIIDKLVEECSENIDGNEMLYNETFNTIPLNLCNGCHDLMQKAISFKHVAIVSIKGNDYRIHFWYMSKNDAITLMTDSNLKDKNGIL